MSVAVCIIVRNGEATIERAISSVRPWVDQVCVYESRSTDRTLDILERLAGDASAAPVKFTSGTWQNDYGWAWREAFAMASPDVDWLLYLEDDEYVVGGTRLRNLDALPSDVDHIYVRRDHLYPNGEVLQSWMIRATRRGACEMEGRVHEALTPNRELGFAVATTDALRIEHPRSIARGDLAFASRVDEAVLAAAELPDASPWLRGFYRGDVLRRRGDLAGAETAFRGFLDETAGKFEHGRQRVYTALADVVLRRDPLESVALLQARDAELDEWRRRAAAGELIGLESLGPDFWAQLDVWERPNARRNDPCPCASGLKFKRCCAERAFLWPVPVAENEMTVAA